ncbi:MAG: glycosyltransferase family 39 protein [Acidobacteria bacterium]|nr:glycosyltransferase family 39 protein [Acidobacteriota bacterium]
MQIKSNEKIWLAFLAAICLVYILLRFWNLTESCLWFDEIFSVHAAEHAWRDLVWFVAQDLIHPPLFYVLLKLWITLGGESLFWLRFFPVLFSIIALVPFYFLCRQLKLNYSTISLAFAFLAANGALIKYAQEVRMYSLVLCLALFSLWFFARFFNLGKGFWALTVVNILLVYTHYFGWLVILSEITVILILQRIKIGRILMMFGVTLVSFTPWIYAVWRAAQINSDFGQNIGWMSKPNPKIVSEFVLALIEPFYFPASTVEASSIFFVSVPLFLIFAVTIILYFSGWRNENETEKRVLYLLTIFTLTPVLLTFAASWILPYSVWGTRHLIIVFAPTAGLLTFFLSKIKNKLLKIGLTSFIFLLSTVAFAIQTVTPPPKFIWCAWENLAQTISRNEPSKIYVFEDLTAYHFWFALQRDSDKIRV